MQNCASEQTLGGKICRVMVVEDNAPDVMLITEALNEQKLRYELTHFSDGDEAVAQLDRSADRLDSYHLIILDLNMPRIGGMEVLLKFRSVAELREVPILVLTSSLSPEEQAEATRLGVNSYLKKPADLDEFLSAVGGTARNLLEAHLVRD